MGHIKTLKHIYLDKLFLIFLLIIIFTGNFNAFFPYFMLLLIHELGHAITGIILGYQLDKITIYPYGGITSFNLPLNIPLKKELLILIMGPLMQIIGYYLLKPFYPFIKVYHYTLLIFNLLPIYPLDGGRIMNILCSYFFNYLESIKISFLFSTFMLFSLFVYNLEHFNLNLLLMIIVLFYKLIDFYRKRYYYYEKFLLERYLYSFSFKRVKHISSIRNFFRDRKHVIKGKEEKSILNDYFKRVFNVKKR